MIQISKVNVLLIVVFISACSLHSASSIAKENIFEKKGILKTKVRVGVLVGESEYFSNNFFYSNPMWWGAELTPPKTITNKLIVKLGDKESWVRFSAYSDLANINDVDLKINDEGFSVVIDGGETATHYTATIYFDNEGFLLKRKVFAGEFPDELWEETAYSFIRRTDM